MKYLGDILTSSTIRGSFNTRTAAGAPITLGGTPALSVYKDGSTTESTTGVTLTVDFDSRTGYHVFAIDTSADGSFYSSGSDFRVVITTGTVDGTSVVGSEVGCFSIQNRTTLIAAGVRSAVGLASANLDTQLSGINSQVANFQFDGDGYLYVDTVALNGDPALAGKLASFADGGVETPSGFVNVASLAADAIGSSQLAASAITEIQSGLATASALFRFEFHQSLPASHFCQCHFHQCYCRSVSLQLLP